MQSSPPPPPTNPSRRGSTKTNGRYRRRGTPTTQTKTDNPPGSTPRIVAVMGPTGAGKSTLIKTATGADDVQVGDGLVSCTQTLQVVPCQDPIDGREFILVDTPGFDDTFRSDMAILEEIAHWLEKTYQKGVKLSGILYLHPITVPRMTNSFMQNLKMLENICGEGALSNVILVTTQWNQLKDDDDSGVRNEEGLRSDFWKCFLDGGSQMLRFTNERSSAWDIIRALPMSPKPLQIQKEMVDEKKALHETSAVQSLLAWFRRSVQLVGRRLTLRSKRKNQTSKELDNADNRPCAEVEPPKANAGSEPEGIEEQHSRPPPSRPDLSSVQPPNKLSPPGDCNTPSSTATTVMKLIQSNPAEAPPPHNIVNDISNAGCQIDVPAEPDTGLSTSGPTCAIQALRLALASVTGISAPGLANGIRVALRIAEMLQEISSVDRSLVDLIVNVGRFIGAICDRDRLAQEHYPKAVNGAMESLSRQLERIEQIAQKLKVTPSSHRLMLDPDDLRATTDCNNAMESALSKLAIPINLTTASMQQPQGITETIVERREDDQGQMKEAPKKSSDLDVTGMQDLCLLISKIISYPPQKVDKLLSGMDRRDAQIVVDSLSAILRQGGSLPTTSEGNHILVMLCKLATSARVYPQCHTLKDVQYDHEPIAVGGFADVHRGQHQGRLVCVKIPRRGPHDNKTLCAYVKELTLWAHLSHRNILSLYGVYLADGVSKVCLVSPWMRNGTLGKYAKKLPQRSRMPLLSDVIDGLAYLHDLNIIHCDLKGENVLISDQGRALIADFGISHITATAGHECTSSLVGCTRHWAAPESLGEEQSKRPTKRPTKPWDIWSFGCLCYEVLSRKIPFCQYCSDPPVIIALHKREIPQRPEPGHNDWDEIDDQMWELMERCWKYAPEDRPTSRDIQDHFGKLGIRDDRAETPASRGSDSTLLNPTEEVPKEVELEQVMMILRDLVDPKPQPSNLTMTTRGSYN